MGTHRHHTLDEFGIRQVSNQGIRIEPLQVRLEPKIPFPHKHDFYQIILICEGNGWHQIDFERYKVDARSLYIVKPGQTHEWKIRSDVKGLVIEFNHSSIGNEKTFVDVLMQIDLMPECMKVDKKEFACLEQICHLMQSEFEGQKKLADQVLKHLVAAFLQMILRNSKAKENFVPTRIVNSFKLLLEQHYKEFHEVQFYAQKCGLAPKAFTMQISRALGKSPRDLIQERLVVEGKRFLAYSDWGIAEIGYELGFADANYFSRFFKQHVGVSPGAFRDDHSQHAV